jgi:hypothetical protein
MKLVTTLDYSEQSHGPNPSKFGFQNIVILFLFQLKVHHGRQ